jgi:hypothetical protein
VGSVAGLLGGADNICVSTDFPHFDSSFPEVSTRALNNPNITPEIAGKILYGGARLYGITGPTSKKPISPPSGGTICTRRERRFSGVRKAGRKRLRAPRRNADVLLGDRPQWQQNRCPAEH